MWGKRGRIMGVGVGVGMGVLHDSRTMWRGRRRAVRGGREDHEGRN